MTYLDRNGNYYEGDPKKYGGATLCMKRPEGNYKLIPDPLSDPMNCWTPKTQADFDAEAAIVKKREFEDKKALKALALYIAQRMGDNIQQAPVRQQVYSDVLAIYDQLP